MFAQRTAVPLLACALLLACLLALALAPQARAETFAVTKTADTEDGDCSADDCSLREAVIEANDTPGADTVNLAAGTYVLTIPGANEDDSQTGDLDVTGTVRVNGQGAGATAVNAGGDGGLGDRVFDVVDDASATITDLTVSGGRPPDDPGRSNGGGISSLGAGALELDGIAVRDNVAGTDGGGVYKFSDDPSNVGTLTITDSTVSGNTARLEGGGICSSDSILTITGSTTSNNTAGNGGGIYSGGIPSSDSTLTMRDSTASNNVADSDGGGISAEEGTATIIRSTVSGNVANSRGGGIEGFYSVLTITGSTLSGNSTAGVGGGVYSDSGRGPGVSEPTTVRNSTLSGNSAGDRGGGYSNLGGVSVLENITVTANTAPEGRGAGVASIGDDQDVTEVFSSVIAANDSTDVDLVEGASGPNGIVSGGYNLIGDGNATGAFSQTGDQTGISDPGLDPLGSYGGPTQTHRLQPDSPAVDAGTNTGCPETDQRGVQRPQDGDADSTPTCDIGSFELEGSENRAPTVRVARGGSCGPASDMRGTINLALSDPDDPPEDLTISATSSNRAVVPNGSISFRGGNDASRTLTVTRLTSSGSSTLTVTASDGKVDGTVKVRVLSGSASDDDLSGSALSDMIFARRGSDAASGRGSKDLLCGGNGRDELTGGLGADHFGGGAGTDTAPDFDASEGDTKAGIP